MKTLIAIGIIVVVAAILIWVHYDTKRKISQDAIRMRRLSPKPRSR